MDGPDARLHFSPTHRYAGVNITIWWDGWAGRATLHDTDATRTHSGVHESNARRMSRRSAKLKCTLTM